MHERKSSVSNGTPPPPLLHALHERVARAVATRTRFVSDGEQRALASPAVVIQQRLHERTRRGARPACRRAVRRGEASVMRPSRGAAAVAAWKTDDGVGPIARSRRSAGTASGLGGAERGSRAEGSAPRAADSDNISSRARPTRPKRASAASRARHLGLHSAGKNGDLSHLMSHLRGFGGTRA